MDKGVDMNILLSSVGIRGYLVRYFQDTGGIDVHVCDVSEYAPALYDADEYHIIQDTGEYVESLVNICKENHIDGLISLNDEEIAKISYNRHLFDNINTELILSRNDVLWMTHDKLVMYEKFRYEMPYTHWKPEWGQFTYPYIIKDRYGSASSGFKKIHSRKEMKGNFKLGRHIAQEYIEGEEYNAQVFNNERGEPVSTYIMKKLRMRAGEVDKAVSVFDDDLIDWIIEIAEKSDVYGPMDIDFIVDGDVPYLIDINPRFGGGYPMAHELGAKFPELIIDLLNGKRLKPDFKVYNSNVVMMKQHEIVYV